MGMTENFSSPTLTLSYEIRTNDFYKDINPDIQKRFYTSDYLANHPSRCKTGLNGKVLGMFNEASRKQIVEFVALRAKLYS